ncbi:thiopurine S-methyltransferase [Seohaeicola saemankumensis]|nr:thiopurine S-methyltransferase [Seohaeicola saemankumensis]MCA0871849.1 thiopurine S-methyltransferase [Seohaeicola saemankumensis]
MDHDFWHQKWRDGQIGFHEKDVNPLLIKNLPALKLPGPSRIFVPLCGKSHDLAWLAEQGHTVVGAELSQQAVEAFFEEHEMVPTVTQSGALRRYRSGPVELLAGDFFDLTEQDLGPVDAVFDRAALVALPAEMRRAYSARLRALTGTAPQLLVSFDYDQSQMKGPPFSVPASEIHAHYDPFYTVDQISSEPISGPLGQRTKGSETVWILSPG